MTSVLKHKILVCVECGEEFVFTVQAQEYFAERGYTEDPKRCKHCYVRHKRDKRNGHSFDCPDGPPDDKLYGEEDV